MDARNGSAAVVDAAIAGCPNGFLVRRQSRLSRDPIEVKIKTRKKKRKLNFQESTVINNWAKSTATTKQVGT
jgi:hypothetical protein